MIFESLESMAKERSFFEHVSGSVTDPRAALKGAAHRARAARREKRKASKGVRMAKRVFRFSLYSFLVLGVFGFLTGLVVFAWYSKDLPSVDQLKHARVAEATEILDRNGKLLYRVHGDENRTIIPLEDIPLTLQEATIAIEDANFYDHPGFDVKATIRVALAHLGILPSSYYRGGGSTITQQLIKNTVVGDERTYARKVKELILSFELERKASKEEILELYLNQISYGSQAYGVEAASVRYFGKSASQLSLSESALLAAVPQASTRLSPHGSHLDQLKARQENVLGRMEKLGYISEEEKNAAIEDDVFARIKPPRESIQAPHFVFHVLELLEEQYGDDALRKSGFKVFTTLDLDEQHIAEEIVAKHAAENIAKFHANNMALVSIDPTDGTIRAMVGSADYYNTDIDGQVNVATSLRQPGSSYKPIVYVRSFEKGYTPNTILMDVSTDFGGGYRPKNYSGGTSGPVSIRKALGQSLNIPAVKLAYLVGVADLIDFSKELGYDNFEGTVDTGLSLGLGSREVSLLDHTGVFAMFAHQGVAVGENSKNAILRIERGGEMEYEFSSGEENRVQRISEEAVRWLTDVLSDDSVKLGNALMLPGRQVATKTGTTSDNYDGWAMGYTPYRVVGVWSGNTDHSATKNNLTGLFASAPAWKEFMTRVHENIPAQSFDTGTIPEVGKNILDGKFETEKVRVCRSSGKLATEDTPESQVEEREYVTLHSILFYVNPKDPRGPRPENPAVDPQFSSWEGAVQEWGNVSGSNEGLHFELPPTESCDAHLQENRPTIGFRSIHDGQEFASGETFRIILDFTTPYAKKQVDFFIDGELIGTRVEDPFEVNYFIPTSGFTGDHFIKARFFDEFDNQAESEIRIRVK